MKFLCIFFVFMVSVANLCAQEQRMSFELAHSGGNCRGCVWIAAEGRIVASTPDDFEKFIEQGYPDADTIFFSSSGGDKEAALKLGVKIKQLRLNTSVGRTIMQADGNFDYAEIDEDAACLGACLWAFLGGNKRSAQANQLGLNRGMMPDLLEPIMTLAIEPTLITELMPNHANETYLLNERDLDRYRLRINPYEFTPWQIEAYKKGVVAYAKTRDEKTIAMLFCDQNNNTKFQVKTPASEQNYGSFQTPSDINNLSESARSLTTFGHSFPKDSFQFEVKDDIFTLTVDIREREKLIFSPDELGLSFVGLPGFYAIFFNRFSWTDKGLQDNAEISFKNCLQKQ